MVKRPASSSSTGSLQRENAKLKKENARLRGETNEKAPVAPNTSEAYITGVCGGAKYMISFDSEGFDQKSNQHFDNLLIWIYSRWSRFWIDLKRREEDFSPKKTFSKNGILPNSFVYVTYTGPPLDDWVWIFVPCDHHCHDKLQKDMREKGSRQWQWSCFCFPCETFASHLRVFQHCVCISLHIPMHWGAQNHYSFVGGFGEGLLWN